jgi:hypothetical protein
MPAILRRIRNLLLDPRNEWAAIATEPGGVRRIFLYVAILASVPALANLVGTTVIGIPTSAGRLHEPLAFAAFKAVLSLLFSFAIVGLTALAVELMAPLFGAARNFTNGLKLAAYSFTPVWLAGIVLLVPGLRFLSLLGLYALRLLWTGLPPLKGVPRPKVLRFTLAIALAAFVLTFTFAVIQAALIALALSY